MNNRTASLLDAASHGAASLRIPATGLATLPKSALFVAKSPLRVELEEAKATIAALESELRSKELELRRAAIALEEHKAFHARFVRLSEATVVERKGSHHHKPVYWDISPARGVERAWDWLLSKLTKKQPSRF